MVVPARVASPASRRRIGASATAAALAGLCLMLLHPHAAFAHHDVVTESADCGGWSSRADYVGGPEDRKVVVDVLIDGEHIAATFYFDDAPGDLGHQDSYVLYERSGTGSVDTSGSITMYERDWRGRYTVVSGIVHPDLHFDASQCATPTATATATVSPTDTPPPTSTATSTPAATRTPTPTDTPAPTDTPIPTATATATAAATNTPLAATPSSTSTPASTPTTPAGGPGVAVTPTSASPTPEATGAPAGTPTEVSIVLQSVRPPSSAGPAPRGPGASFLPDAGLGRFAGGPAGTAVLAAGFLGGALLLLVAAARLRRHA